MVRYGSFGGWNAAVFEQQTKALYELGLDAVQAEQILSGNLEEFASLAWPPCHRRQSGGEAKGVPFSSQRLGIRLSCCENTSATAP